MEAKSKEIDIGEKNIIIKLWKEGKTFHEIGATLTRTHSSVQLGIKNFKENGV